MGRFYLYKGLATFIRESGIDSNVAKFSIDHDEVSLMHHFNCKPEWPICLFDFSYGNRCPSYFCFRVGHKFNDLVVENYFTTEYQIKKERSKSKDKLKTLSQNPLDDLLIERN